MKNDDLEKMVDTFGLYGVLDQLQTIAYEKAEHLESNWQDEQAAKTWRKCASLISTVEFKVSQLLP